MERKPESFLPMSPMNYFILVSLSQDDKHGYVILRDIEEISDGEVRPSVGNLYIGLRRLAAQGLIERVGEEEHDDGDRRKIYHLTGLGERVLQAETQRLDRTRLAALRAMPRRIAGV